MSTYLLELTLSKEIAIEQAQRIYGSLLFNDVISWGDIPYEFLCFVMMEYDTSIILSKGFSPRDLSRLLNVEANRPRSAPHLRVNTKLNKHICRILTTMMVRAQDPTTRDVFLEFKKVCLEYQRVINWAGSRWHAILSPDEYLDVLTEQMKQIADCRFQLQFLNDLKSRHVSHSNNTKTFSELLDVLCCYIDRESLIAHFMERKANPDITKRMSRSPFDHPFFNESWNVANLVTI